MVVVGSQAITPPPIWKRKRGEEMFHLPVLVELFQEHAWHPNAEALKILAPEFDPEDLVRPWQPGQENDAKSFGGRLRLTFPTSDAQVMIGRARGRLDQVLLNGGSLQAAWLGLDAGHDPQCPKPRGWHPFVAPFFAGSTFVLDLKGARLSQLCVRTVGDT